MPFTPPAALISLIAIMVASCSDFSTIDSPPVSENSTPTLISPAACAPVENTQGDVINAPPARAPPFRNLRLSTVIPHSPLAPDTSLQTNRFIHGSSVAPKHAGFPPEIRQDRSSTVNT